jgi:hypothetical protein
MCYHTYHPGSTTIFEYIHITPSVLCFLRLRVSQTLYSKPYNKAIISYILRLDSSSNNHNADIGVEVSNILQPMTIVLRLNLELSDLVNLLYIFFLQKMTISIHDIEFSLPEFVTCLVSHISSSEPPGLP